VHDADDGSDAHGWQILGLYAHVSRQLRLCPTVALEDKMAEVAQVCAGDFSHSGHLVAVFANHNPIPGLNVLYQLTRLRENRELCEFWWSPHPEKDQNPVFQELWD
jgi:hypothetical protein